MNSFLTIRILLENVSFQISMYFAMTSSSSGVLFFRTWMYSHSRASWTLEPRWDSIDFSISGLIL